MHSESNSLLLDSGRYPLWFRIPAAAIGLSMWWFCFLLAADSYFGRHIGPTVNRAQGSPLLAIIIIFGIGLAMLYVWVAQVRIYFDPIHNCLYEESHGFFRWRGRSLPITDAREFHIRFVTIYCGGVWKLSMNCADGSSRRVTSLPRLSSDTTWLRSFRDALQQKTGLQVILHERR